MISATASRRQSLRNLTREAYAGKAVAERSSEMSGSTTGETGPKRSARPAAWHTLTAREVAARLQVEVETGLDFEEAIQRREKFGPNRLAEAKRAPMWQEFLDELREPMVLLLLFTGTLYALWGELRDAITIFIVILALKTIEVINEQRARRAILAWRKHGEPYAPVLRAGSALEIPTEQIVPGDLILVQAGRRIPADARLVTAYRLQVDESPLTGEALPVEKEAGLTLPDQTLLAERCNLVFAGTLATSGRGSAVATHTGMETELGRLTSPARQVKEPRTPLLKAMDELSRWLVWPALSFSLLVPALGVAWAGQPLQTMLLTGLSLAFATIPGELPVIITMALALGGLRLSHQLANAKRLKAIETLSAVTVIATDKTGTLTENRMAVQVLFPETARPKILEAGVLCNAANLNSQIFTGDPLETALLTAAGENGLNVPALQKAQPLLVEFSFDNTRKCMSVVRQRGEEARVTVKGAPEGILAASTHQWTAYDPQLESAGREPLSEEDRQAFLETAAQMAAGGLHAIAFAEKSLPAGPVLQEQAETGLTFLGLAGLEDPPRPGAMDAIAACRRAGIRPVMVTGDHPLTALAIARQVGLGGDGQILTGPELERLSDEELMAVIGEVSVFARTAPQDKLRLVQAFQRRGERVAVTGDGINDAPALAAADIGVAMGESGSDVAREIADIVLGDDNFNTFLGAIREGRVLYENLKKAIRYYLAIKLALVLITVLPVLLQAPVPFTPIQIILVELFAGLAVAAAFLDEPGEGDLMNRPPRNPKARFLDQEMVSSILTSTAGLFIAVSAVYLTILYSGAALPQAQTAAFAAWIIGHVFLAFNMRTNRQPLFQVGLFSNRVMIVWSAAAFFFLLFATQTSLMQAALGTVPPDTSQWALIGALTIASTFWTEIRKLTTYQPSP